MKKVAVVGVPGGWSSERLADKIEERTQFRLLVDMACVRLDLDSGRVWFEDHDLSELDGMIVKKVGPAYSPGLLDRLEILDFLCQKGVRIFSRPLHIARMLDRLSCTLALAQGEIPLPPTVVTEDLDEAEAAVNRFGRSVLKPLYTSKARGMAVVEPGPTLSEELANYKASGNEVIYIQQMINLPGRDLGVVFLGGKYLATYARVGQKGAWNTTTASGGRYQAHQPSPKIIELAERAQSLFGLDFTCVDIAESDQGPVVFEVSAFGGFRGLQEGCGIDAAGMFAQYVLKELG